MLTGNSCRVGVCVCVSQAPDMSREPKRVVGGRESVSASPVCNTFEMHPAQREKQLLDHEELEFMSECESLILVRL